MTTVPSHFPDVPSVRSDEAGVTRRRPASSQSDSRRWWFSYDGWSSATERHAADSETFMLG